MAPYWLLLDIHDLAKFAALTFFAGCSWVAFAAREFANHRSTVETPVPEGTPAPSGAGIWVVESEREGHPAHLLRDGSARAVAAAGPSATRTP